MTQKFSHSSKRMGSIKKSPTSLSNDENVLNSISPNSVPSTSSFNPSLNKNLPKPKHFFSIHCDGNYVSNLQHYKSTSIDNSIMRTWIYKPYLYENLIKLIPIYFHPNIVTLLGALAIVIQVITCVYFSENMTVFGVPSWVFFLAGFCLFVYQTLDNLDGMQARRTGTSSALGELYDHGIDALVTGLCSYAWMSVIAKGISTYSFIGCLPPALAFIGATWQEYYDSSLTFGYINGPNEGLFLVITSFYMTGLIGHQNVHLPLSQLLENFGLGFLSSFLSQFLNVRPLEFLNTIFGVHIQEEIGLLSLLSSFKLNFILNHSIIHLSICFTVTLSFMTLLGHLIHVFMKKPSHFLQNIQTLFPYFIEMTCTYLWIALSDITKGLNGIGGIPNRYPILFWLNHALLFAYLGSQITLAFVLKAPLTRFFWALVPYMIGTLNAHFMFLPFSEDLIFMFIFIWGLLNYIIFVLDVTNVVSNTLDIGVLRMTPKQYQKCQQLQKME